MRSAIPLVLLSLAACGGRMQPAQLAGTSWQLVELRSSGNAAVRVSNPAEYTIAFEHDGTAAMRLDCNRAQGSYLLTPTGFRGGRIEFGQIAGTHAACPPGSLDQRLVRELPSAQRYRMEGETLQIELTTNGGQQIWRRVGL